MKPHELRAIAIILAGAVIMCLASCHTKHQCVKQVVVGGPGLLVTNYKDGLSMIILDTNYIQVKRRPGYLSDTTWNPLPNKQPYK